MSIVDLEERDIKIEHIEGYLYGIQEVENLIRRTQDASFEYSINELEANTEKTDTELVVQALLERLRFSDEITSAIWENFNSNMKPIALVDWKSELSEILNKWCIGKHLSAKFVREDSISYMNQFSDWTETQKKEFI